MRGTEGGYLCNIVLHIESLMISKVLMFKALMEMVPRDGIEPPTRGFSIRKG